MMKYIVLMIASLSVCFSNGYGQTEQYMNIFIEVKGDYQAEELSRTTEKPIHLHLVGENALLSKSVDKLKALPSFTQIREVSITGFKTQGKTLTQFFDKLADSNVESMELADIKVKSSKAFVPGSLISKLKSLKITNTKLNKAFYENLSKTPAPNLRRLEIVNGKLKEWFPSCLTAWGVIEQLEYLDLSNNKLDNFLLGIFPLEKPGNLKVLKLNNTELTLNNSFVNQTTYNMIIRSSRINYMEAFPAVSYFLGKWYIDWSKPFFRKLTRLEMQKPAPKRDQKSIEFFYRDSTLSKIEILLGPVYSPANKKPALVQQQRIEFYKNIFEGDIQTRIHNFNMQTPEEMGLFLSSPMSKHTENIIFDGERWYDVTVREILRQIDMPALKTISLNDVNMTEEELYRLIQDYPQYNFDILTIKKFYLSGFLGKLKSDYSPQYWPHFERK